MALRVPRRQIGTVLAGVVAAGVIGPHAPMAGSWMTPGEGDPHDPTGCPDLAVDDGAPAELSSDVEVSGITVRLEPDGRLAVGANAFDVRVARATAGAPGVDGLVFVTTRMPSMDHGESGYPARSTARGRYRVEGVSLGMAGAWLVTVHVIRQARAPVAVAYRVGVPPA